MFQEGIFLVGTGIYDSLGAFSGRDPLVYTLAEKSGLLANLFYMLPPDVRAFLRKNNDECP